MHSFTLYTYRNVEELRKIQQENDVFPFIEAQTENLLCTNSNILVDISDLIYFLQVDKNMRLTTYKNLTEATDETAFIIKETLKDDVFSIFPYISFHSKPYFESDTQQENKSMTIETQYLRKTIYSYNNVSDLNTILEYAKANNILIITFSNALRDIERFNKYSGLVLLDFTSVLYAIDNNKNLIYSVELLLNSFPNIEMIALISQINNIIEYFPLYVENQKPIDVLLPEIKIANDADDSIDKVTKITSMSKSDRETFIQNFNNNLIGHDHFKERFNSSINNFVRLNKVKEQKVLSIFLFGASGIGKTEVARVISKELCQNAYLAKINFQNYSSQDALNSLIGSPAGYVGCNNGELSDKVKKSNVGIILCDEFEKATKPVFSFFLELLEDGRFTDSMAREYDLDGYILLFTSNIRNESEYKAIMPPELQTRFDLVCEFEEPSNIEKNKFIELLLSQAKTKFADYFAEKPLTKEIEKELYELDYSNINSLRDIKKLFNDILMDYFDSE